MDYLLNFAIPLLSVVLATASPIASPITGSITTPLALTDISGEPFPFTYDVSNWCEQGYNNFTVFATQGNSAPTVADLDDNGNPPEFLTSWGVFTVANFGLPTIGTPPPSTLTTPFLPLVHATSDAPAKLHLSVVQTFANCPGRVAKEFGIASIPVVYSGAANTA